MRRVNFTLDGTSYSFDENGDFKNGYDLITWKEKNDGRVIELVGKFLIQKGDVEIFSEYHWINETVSGAVVYSNTCVLQLKMHNKY